MSQSSRHPAQSTSSTRLNRPLTRPLARLGDWSDFGLLGSLVHAAAGDAIRIEEYSDGTALIVRAELPGIDPDRDVELSVSDGVLHIRATRENSGERLAVEGFRTEFHYGSFMRSVALPVGAYEHEIKAAYSNGILEVRVPITKTATHRIEIEHA
jgi:HSP20 family protein